MLLGLGIDILSLTRLESLISRRGADKLAARICCSRELEEFRRRFSVSAQAEAASTPIPIATSQAISSHAPRRCQDSQPASTPTPKPTQKPPSQDPEVLRFLAARWTTKEAAYKALPTPVSWKDLDLTYGANGRPHLSLLDSDISLLASISHDAGVVVAAVVAERR